VAEIKPARTAFSTAQALGMPAAFLCNGARNSCILSALGVGIQEGPAMRSAELVLAVCLLAGAPAAGERLYSTLQPSNPCGFFRDQAWGKGIGHYATEMLWACEAIAMRRGAGLPLGDRLEAVDLALARYHDAVVARPEDAPDLARTTGALDALQAVAAGF
jgi:hypothetical protein